MCGKVHALTFNLYGSFGFEDGISQPLIDGVDDEKVVLATPIMVTDPKIIVVTNNTRVFQGGGITRPDWMSQGSFLVFRKLEQNVKAFQDLLTKDFKKYGCKTADHLGAKLMGRWPSGTQPEAMPSRKLYLLSSFYRCPDYRAGFPYFGRASRGPREGEADKQLQLREA